MALSLSALTWRAMVHDSFQSARLANTLHDAMKAGQAARISSRPQPGKAVKLTGVKVGACASLPSLVSGVAGFAGTGLATGGVWPVATLLGAGGVVQADKKIGRAHV